jgi:hypothetical protein
MPARQSPRNRQGFPKLLDRHSDPPSSLEVVWSTEGLPENTKSKYYGNEIGDMRNPEKINSWPLKANSRKPLQDES